MPRPDRPLRYEAETTGPRTLIVALPGASWNDLRRAEMPNLHRLMTQAAVGLMPVAAPSDPDRNRTWVTLSAGRAAAGVAEMPSAEPWQGRYRLDLGPIRVANERTHTGAQAGLLGTRLHALGLTTAVLSPGTDGSAAFAALSDERGRVDAGWAGEAYSNPDRLHRALADALLQHAVVLVDLSGKASLSVADEIIGDALAALEKYPRSLVFVLCPVSPAYHNPEVRTLGPVVIWERYHGPDPGLLTSASTRWAGLVTAADLAPTVLSSLGVWSETGDHRVTGRVMRAVVADHPLRRLDSLDRLLTDRYRLRVVMAKWYAAYGLLVVLAALAVAVARPGRLKLAAGPALALALVPAGLALAAPTPPGHDIAYLTVAALAAGGLAWLAARLGSSTAEGLAVGLLSGAGVIVADVISGSALMRESALDMGVMTGSRFYGIGNEYTGALVGMTTIGLGALLEARPGSGKLTALIAVAVVLAIGAPFWGANWGGSVTAAAGLASLWLLSLPRVRLRHALGAVGVVALGALAPACLDLLRPESARSHIGAGAAALLSGQTAAFGDIVWRKLRQNLAILRAAPWSVIAAALCASVFLALLRAGGHGRRALAGQRLVAAGIAAALIAGLVAMVVNDSGVAAGFGAILAALGATVFLAARVPEVTR